MNFISYAQNFEDVVLWRAFKGVKKGFYIDVGAWSPSLDSVTKAFYDMGWTGINLEPNPEMFDLIALNRTKDVNLNIGISNESGIGAFYEDSASGLSTFVPEFSRTAKKVHSVGLETLSWVFENHVPASQPVHFLKIDVEGFESNVIDGNNWSKNRPWVVLVEAFLPTTQVPSHEKWETVLLNSGYIFVYADGLNRFYLSREQMHLKTAFEFPPNVFDSFTLAREHWLIAKYDNQISDLESDLDTVREEKVDLSVALEFSKIRVAELEASLSWKLTEPLRNVASRLQIFLPKSLLLSLLLAGSRFKIIARLLAVMRNVFPGLATRILRRYGLVSTPIKGEDYRRGDKAIALNSRSNNILRDLR